MTNVTRFGEIWPFGKFLYMDWQYFEGLFSIWYNFVSTWANFVCFGQMFIVENSHIMKNK